MMHEFLTNNRADLMDRCRAKVAQRPGRAATGKQLENGVPMFLDQLIRTLQLEEAKNHVASTRISGPSSGAVALSEMGTSAARHGKDLLELGFSVDQVVHDYGDLCQAINDLAVERDAPFRVDEFRTLNRCLDNAIADAVTEFSYQRDFIFADSYAKNANERIGYFAHEMRNHLNTASLAFAAAKTGNLGLSGATGTVLKRSLDNLEILIGECLQGVRQAPRQGIALNAFSLSDFIAEVRAAADLSVAANGHLLTVSPVDPDLAVVGNRSLLFSAVANLVQNALKFTQAHSEVILSAFASGNRILIEVKDQCGGLPHGASETMFLPFSQNGKDRTGVGLGLSIALQCVLSNNGSLTVEDMPGTGCTFRVSLPRHSMPG